MQLQGPGLKFENRRLKLGITLFPGFPVKQGDHHPAMPAGVLVALMSLALFWGWPQVCRCFWTCLGRCVADW